jgi:hypothetical protein
MPGNRTILLVTYIIAVSFLYGCGSPGTESATLAGRKPVIRPDYTDVTIPPNIAPMNFSVDEKAGSFRAIAVSSGSGMQVKIKSRNSEIKFPERSWKKLLNDSRGGKIEITVFTHIKGEKTAKRYDPFFMQVSEDLIDPYLAYRVIYPGYYSWSRLKLVQRSVESFSEHLLFDNEIMEKNCVNCHSFNNNSADRFMIHVRGSLGGTYIADHGKITKVDPKIDAMPGGATYPSWHPGGRFMAFSSNQVRQSFYSVPEKNIEVFDLVSSIICYDREANEVICVNNSDTTKYLETFPSWAPDGKYLYYCRAVQYISDTDPQMEQIMKTRYDLVRRAFEPETRAFGEPEVIFNASAAGKSVSFPRVSPDGKFLVVTLSDYGTFPIWHREADLWMIDLQTGAAEKMAVNSEEPESYHTWSLNSRWLVFSSRRLDGRSGRPYFVHIDPQGRQGKEFVLPQKDPGRYDKMLESFNIPEFVDGRIKLKPRDFAGASRSETLKANAADPASLKTDKTTKQIYQNDRPIHE